MDSGAFSCILFALYKSLIFKHSPNFILYHKWRCEWGIVACKFEYPKGSGNWYQGTHISLITQEQFKITQNKLVTSPKGQWGRKEFFFTKIYVSGYKDEKGNVIKIFGVGDDMSRAEASKVIVNVFEL